MELLGHTGFVGAFAFHAPEYDAVLVGTHNASHVDRWPLVAMPGAPRGGLTGAVCSRCTRLGPLALVDEFGEVGVQ